MAIRVLLVDPDECILDSFATLLQRHGFDVLTASNEKVCVRHLCESAPNVLVLEPCTDHDWGHRLLEKPHVSDFADVPTVVVSRLTPDDVKLSSTAPIFRWHIKPVKTSDLANTLSKAVQA